MGTPSEPVIVAENGRFVVAEDGPRVLVLDRGATASEVTVLLLVIASLVFGGFGVVSLLQTLAGGMAPTSTAVGAVFLVVGIASFVAMVRLVGALNRARLRPLSAVRPAAVFDRARRVYLDGDGEIVAPLGDVRFERRMQLASSSPKLVAVTPAGTRVLLRGSPFTGGVGNLDAVLTAVVRGAR